MKCQAVLAIALALPLACAFAQDASSSSPPASPEPSRALDYVLGASATYKPSYSGSARETWGLKPTFGLRWGRFRISSGGASRLLGFGNELGSGSGASADLITSDQLKLRLSLRAQSGRSSSSAADLAGQADVRRTLRARLSASYALTERWSAQASWSNDLLGRGGGTLVDTGLGWSHWLTGSTQLSADAGLSFADSTYLRSYYGTSASTSATGAHPAFAPKAGVYSAHISVGTTTALSRRWLVYTSLGYSHLLGDAARSPLTRQDGAASLSMGLAYRCCALAP